MKNSRKAFIKCIGILLLVVTSAAQADDDLVDEVISSQLRVSAQNPRNSTEEELNKAAISNSDLRLRHVLLHETANTELKLLFGLHVLRRRIEEARRGKAAGKLGLPYLLKRQTELAKLYRALHERKTNPEAPDEPNEIEEKLK